MYTLGQIVNSEFDLMGVMSDEELLGAIQRAPQAERKAFLKRIKQPKPAPAAAAPSNTSRAEFEKRLHLLPKDIQEGLANKTLQAVDVAYYVTKDISNNKVVKMFKDDDNKVVGISNISSAKLEKGNLMLLSGIILLGANGAVRIEEAAFYTIPEMIRNGEFEFKANGTTLIPSTSCEVFYTDGTDRQMGYYKLDNAKIIYDQQAIELNVEWGVNVGETNYLKAILVGTAVTKY
ncbi:MAG: hypothetical protein U0T82_11890 [Bacteroidales bacterium]